ncbi:hypothetical protein, partial [Klebsiella pneumoniae]|uniref:hypothetical protein n=4 Tax=Gammaproteobacteria TaxID=1236 RepID=UPI0019D6CA62
GRYNVNIMNKYTAGLRFHDISAFPACVFIPERIYSGYGAKWGKELLYLFSFKKPFTLVFINAFNESKEDRIYRFEWMKHNQQLLSEYCRSIITIITDKDIRESIILQGAASTYIFTIPHEVVGSFTEALTLTDTLIPDS